MWILGIFLLLSLIESGVVYYYWSRVHDVVELGTELGGKVINTKYKNLAMNLVAKIKNYKKLLWIPVGIIIFVNFIVSLILGGLLMITMGLIN